MDEKIRSKLWHIFVTVNSHYPDYNNHDTVYIANKAMIDSLRNEFGLPKIPVPTLETVILNCFRQNISFFQDVLNDDLLLRLIYFTYQLKY